jgi:ribosomal protein L7/L12
MHPELPAAAIDALKAGQKMTAIKIVREQQHVGLKQAKQQVDAHLATAPRTFIQHLAIRLITRVRA